MLIPHFGQIRIRPARETDIDAIQAIFRDDMKQARLEKRASGLGAPYLNADRDFIRRRDAGEDRYQIVVAEKEGTVVGYARALHRLDKRSPSKSTDAGARQTTLHKLGVLGMFHHQGIGSLLMTAVIEKARQLGRETIRITLPDGNPLAFYRRFGFRKVARLPSPGGNKRPLDIIELDLRLSARRSQEKSPVK